ncbi:unnamed protein product [Linum tenue]|uniref:MSP domain-containing protein n=1 Tax=Linum tenue TaxID=586396 RepID=A0AAV0QXY0_9ROSI|nr:unnamed protein product [Linum tenue]
MPFWQTAGNATTSSSSSSSSNTNSSSTSSSSLNSTAHHNRAGDDPNQQNHGELPGGERSPTTVSAATTVSLVAKSLLPTRRRLKLDPASKLYFPLFKFVEPPENIIERQLDLKSRVKFKIMSLKVKGEMEYVPELFDDMKDQAAVEQILRVVFLDPESPNPALQKLNRQLAEAEAELENRKKPPEEPAPRPTGEGLVIDEWKERRERYLAQQQVEVGPV